MSLLIRRIYFFTFDCLRADHLSVYGGKTNTRFFDRLAHDGVVVRKFFSGGGTTFSAFPTMFLSRYFFFMNSIRPDPFTPTLAEIIARSGFYNIGVSSNMFVSEFFGWNRGFHLFFDEQKIRKKRLLIASKSGFRHMIIRKFKRLMSITKATLDVLFLLKKIKIAAAKKLPLPYMSADEILLFLEKKVIPLLKRKEKTFLWVHFMDNHYPFFSDIWKKHFDSLDEYVAFLTKIYFKRPKKVSCDELKFVRLSYKKSVMFIDNMLGRLIEILDENNLLEDSLIILTADHGEELLEHGKFGHWHQHLYNEIIRVPLIIAGDYINTDRIPSATRYSFSTLDIPPTILDLLGLKKPKKYLGKSIMRCDCERPIFSNVAKVDYRFKIRYQFFSVSVVLWPWKLISSPRGIELYNIEKDPQERKNLFLSHVELTKELFKLIVSHIKSSRLYRKKLRILRRYYQRAVS